MIPIMHVGTGLIAFQQSFLEFAVRIVTRLAAPCFCNLRSAFSRSVALVFGYESEAVFWQRFWVRQARQRVEYHTMRYAK